MADNNRPASAGKFYIYRTPTRAKTTEKIVNVLLAMLTYAIILAATGLFGVIAWKGSQTVFKGGFNWEFLSEYPQTLYVFGFGELSREAEPGTTVADVKSLILTNPAVKEKGIREVTLYNDLFEYKPESGELVLAKAVPASAEKLQTLSISYTYQLRESDMPDYKAVPPVTVRLGDVTQPVAKYELGDLDYRAFLAEIGEDSLQADTYSYVGGGIMPAIVGTFLLVLGAMAIALFFGILSAIYLSEYSRPGTQLNLIRLSILNLAGVPSIVFGLFGYAAFVIAFGFGTSLLAGWLTLAFMVLPVIIAASEESLRSIPQGFREGSLALGASKWTAIRTNVLPYAMPGILTSSILGIARVAGETAPIMFTAAYATRDRLPWEVDIDHWWQWPGEFVTQGVMALPYHIYVVSSKIPQNQYTEGMQFGTSFIFMLLIFGIALTSILLRVRMRKRYSW